MLLRACVDVFVSNYKELKGIPPSIVEQKKELDTTIVPSH
jgi:hypothetical protein